jgi:hypothetical protein
VPRGIANKQTLVAYLSQVVAYGQTGSGKTHTMGAGATVVGAHGLAPDALAADDGVVPRALAELFAALDAKRASGDAVATHVRASFLEIYNEEAGISVQKRCFFCFFRFSFFIFYFSFCFLSL